MLHILQKNDPFMKFISNNTAYTYFLPIESLVVLFSGQIVGLGAS